MDYYINPNSKGMPPSNGILNSKEAALYLKISVSTLNKLTMRRVIPFSKPGGKLKYFEKEKLEAYITSKRFPTRKEMENNFLNHLTKNHV